MLAEEKKESGGRFEESRRDPQDERKYLIRRRVVSIVSFLILIGFFAVVAVYVGKPMINLAKDPETFRLWVDSHGFGGKLAMVGMMVLQVVVAVIPGEALEIGAGYAFGAWEGLLLCLIGAAIGSAIIFFFVKLLGVKMVEAFISREKINSLKFIKSSRRLNLLMFILFFIPGTPKDLFTYFAGLTPMKLHTFLMISTIARIPSVITSTIGGHALGTQQYVFAAVVFAITIIVSLIGILVYRRISKQEKEKEKEESQNDTISQG